MNQTDRLAKTLTTMELREMDNRLNVEEFFAGSENEDFDGMCYLHDEYCREFDRIADELIAERGPNKWERMSH